MENDQYIPLNNEFNQLNDKFDQLNEPLKFKDTTNKYKMDKCPITFESFSEKDDVIELTCGHIFSPLIKVWFTTSNICPLCKQ